MNDHCPKSRLLIVSVLTAIFLTGSLGAAPKPDWSTVVNNNDLIPPLETRNFNSYNQPSVNVYGLVVIRARSRGGPPLGPATHGIYTRDMSVENSPIVSVLDRNSPVPEPNNLATLFVETPSFPRIDMWSDTIATRGNHQPVWNYVVGTDPATGEDIETKTGTTGIYSNPFGPLVTGGGEARRRAGFFLLRGTRISRNPVRGISGGAFGNGEKHSGVQGELYGRNAR